MVSRRLAALLTAVALGVVACSAAPAGPSAQIVLPESTHETVPGDDWVRTDAGAAGFDPEALGRVEQHLAAEASSCFVVTRDGELVHEAYFDGTDHLTMRPAFSITKSLTSVLVGIAADEGRLSLDDAAATYVPQWRGTPAEDVTIRDLLANTSGRYWDYRTDYEQMAVIAADKTAFSIGLAQDAAPGTVWHYNNAAIQTLEAVLSAATGVSPAEYARTRLLDPLQMNHTSWASDAAGRTMVFSGVSASCLDLARFGVLMLRRGDWAGDRVVSAEFVDEATGRSSSRLNAAYGLLWWVNQPGIVLGALTATGSSSPDTSTAPPHEGRLAPNVPADAFWALGLGKQIIAVIPSEGIVAVRMGAMPPGANAASPDRFTSDVLNALE